MPIRYTDQISNLSPDQIAGFFVDWPNSPDTEKHMEVLRNSYKVWLAFDGDKCVGFINAISDGVFCSHIPLLEVLPKYRRKGIGSELVKRMVNSLEGMYAIDIVCDESVAAFYEDKGFDRRVGMVKRNYDNQGSANNSIQSDARASRR